MPGRSGILDEQHIALGPDCTIRSIGEIHRRFQACELAQQGPIRVDCGEVEQVDVTFVQLVESARATLAARGIGLVLEPVSERVRSAFERAGLGLPGAAPLATGG